METNILWKIIHGRSSNQAVNKLYKAVLYNNEASVLDLLDVKLDTQDDNGNTVLHKAAISINPHITHTLLCSNIDPNIQNSDGNTALHIAAYQNNTNILFYLLRHNVCPTTQNNKGQTFLHILSMHPKTNCLQYLYKPELYMNIQDKNGNTALHLAMYYKNINIIKYLSSIKSDITICNIKKMDVLGLASLYLSKDEMDLLGYDAIGELLNCPVCMEDYYKLLQLHDNTKHMICINCLDKLARKGNIASCPFCRFEFSVISVNPS